MGGVVEEGAKVATGFIDSMRNQPLVLMMGLMNIVLLVFLFYYLTRITARTESTVKDLFAANDKIFDRWATVIKDQGLLVEKTMHCILPEDAIKLLQVPRYEPQRPAAPERPGPLWLPLDQKIDWPEPPLLGPPAPPMDKPKE
jgi:hypothetical protein